MAKFIASIKAIITRLVFASHGFIAIWQVTNFKRNPIYWYLCCPIILLFFEGIFTLTIKANQEWKWFCPSVFLYLGSVVPAIWLLELDKVDRRLRNLGSNINFNDTLDLTNLEDLKQLQKTLGVNIRLPDIQISTETWVTLIEQFLMLILIIGRWMLPKGELTRDQLSQLLLVYIGTAADIIEFFDSFKEDKVAREPMLVYLTLGIWAWSLMQFTVVLTATKSRKSRLSSGTAARKKVLTKTSCCGIDVWAIGINMVLQDGPFLAFRLILIIHYKIVSYMNIFFTCKNTLVILLQLYRLYVVQSESRSRRRRQRQKLEYDKYEIGNISVISRPDTYAVKKYAKRRKAEEIEEGVGDDDNDNDNDDYYAEKKRKMRGPGRRKDLEANVVDSEDLDTEPSDRYITSSKNKGSDHRKSRQETDRSRSSSQGRGKRSHDDRRRACEKEKQQQQQEQQRRRQKQEYRESEDLEWRSSSEQRPRKKSARRVADLDRNSKEKRRHTEVDEHDGGSTSDDSQSESEERRKYHRRKQRPPNRD
ncbi:PREDICTED: transmembrane protein 26 [Ceratosolen solmsi marchali]|uniref:Transmembrane protein 26 n=1 Tax=Ceratosolen solmsi marchali TaxID=326594 RepID=A0AAJ6YKB5_9HYME|nr:PREDICTED: transmembrane protein 26 [Ceratosolen solmsi marchali]